jgi:6-phosphogluconolactonase
MCRISLMTTIALAIVGASAVRGTAGLDGQDDRDRAGTVFVGTNHNNTSDPKQPPNQVLMYRRGSDGKLKLLGAFDTGGQGSGPSVRFAGDGLGSAHSVRLSQDCRWLFVTNAGSNNVSVFRVLKDYLERTDLKPTGDFPNSVTQHGDLVYVLSAAGRGSISGFRLSDRGTLTPIPGSTRVLRANQNTERPDTLFNPAQVSFTPDGRRLVVTIKDGPAAFAIPNVIPTGPGRVLVFDVNSEGLPSETFKQTNLENRGPFGFSFDRNGNMLIALFVGGPEGTAAAGSYRIDPDGTLSQISLAPDTQIDTCWLENNGEYAWGSNYTSGTISSFRIGKDGSLTLLEKVSGETAKPDRSQGSTPLDLGVSPDGRFLYNVLPGSGKVAGWRIHDDGRLEKVGEFPGLPQTVDGDHAPSEFGPGGSPAGIAVL